MENPMSWGPVEKVIHEARLEWQKNQEEMRFGYSLEMLVANALRKAGLINE